MSELYVEDPLAFWCNNYGLSGAEVVFLGVPFDGTSSGRSGSREAPNSIRAMSYSLETYSASARRDLKELKMADYGNVIVSPGDTGESLRRIKAAVADIREKFPVVVGGEHIITLPVVQALLRRHPKLQVLHFDAHLDLKEDYVGNRYSHVTVMRRLAEILGHKMIVHAGARSFSQEEHEFARKNDVLKPVANLAEFRFKGPVYITLDMDVFDPAFAPGVSTPAPAGMLPQEFFSLIESIHDGMEVIGFDVVEVCPPNDTGNVTSLLAAKAIKEMLLAFKH
ncbi:MAG: agmatinase [Candidatus Aenigmarchaeota archaeon]|nr:agmatinase [Candidatus Aenigmarchaeota archaeon]